MRMHLNQSLSQTTILDASHWWGHHAVNICIIKTDNQYSHLTGTRPGFSLTNLLGLLCILESLLSSYNANHQNNRNRLLDEKQFLNDSREPWAGKKGNLISALIAFEVKFIVRVDSASARCFFQLQREEDTFQCWTILKLREIGEPLITTPGCSC